MVDCATHNFTNHFKCPGSYCIPWRLVCDKKTDCLDRQDERYCSDYRCPGMLKCKGEVFCVHPSEVCDNIRHCPH